MENVNAVVAEDNQNTTSLQTCSSPAEMGIRLRFSGLPVNSWALEEQGLLEDVRLSHTADNFECAYKDDMKVRKILQNYSSTR